MGEHIPAEMAERKALGLITASGGARQLPEVNLAATIAMGTRLTEDMIDRATLPPLPWDPSFNPHYR